MKNLHRFFEASTYANNGYTSGLPNFSACANWQTSELMSHAKAEQDALDKHKPPHSMLLLDFI